MVKNTECLNTTNCCLFKCSNVTNTTTVFNSRRCFKGIFKIIHSLKITEEKTFLREFLEKLLLSDTAKVVLKIRKKH